MLVENILENWGFPGLRLLAGFNSRDNAAAWMGISERTLRRRELAGDESIARILAAKAGFLGVVDPTWHGWILRNGLINYGRQDWRPGDLLALQYERALTAELRRQVRQHEKAAGDAAGRTLAPVLRLDDYR